MKMGENIKNRRERKEESIRDLRKGLTNKEDNGLPVIHRKEIKEEEER